MVSGGFFLDFVFETAIAKSLFRHASRRLIVSSVKEYIKKTNEEHKLTVVVLFQEILDKHSSELKPS